MIVHSMPTSAVNLDALIMREDFEVSLDPKRVPVFDEADRLKIVELEHDSLMYRMLRKPDFQRTTAHWSSEKIAAFVKSFLAGDLIPALILWRSDKSGSIFVIDGAHRLSALLAWVHDDYGDRHISMPFFEGNIPKPQRENAEDTRKLIANGVGTYVELKHGRNLSQERTQYASNLAAGCDLPAEIVPVMTRKSGSH